MAQDRMEKQMSGEVTSRPKPIGECSVDGCEKPGGRAVRTESPLCESHYQRGRRESLLIRLRELNRPNGDIEGQHSEADDALLDYIDDPEITDAYAAIDKWYA